MTPCRAPPRSPARTPPGTVRRNENGEIISWCASSEDGKLLTLLVAQGIIRDDWKPAAVKERYTNFREYASNTLSSALHSARKKVQGQVQLERGSGSSGGCSQLLSVCRF